MARVVPRTTDPAKTIISSMVIGSVVAWPIMLLAAESPTRIVSRPASSKTWAIWKS
jgi:hypothetical protein